MQPRVSAITCYEAGLVCGLMAFAFAVVATKRGSALWWGMIGVSAWFCLTSFMSEL